MTTDHKIRGMESPRSSYQGLVVAIIALALPVFYIGSYVALADNSGHLELRSDGACHTSHYRCGGEFTEAIYWPALYVDRLLRPGHWSSPADPAKPVPVPSSNS